MADCSDDTIFSNKPGYGDLPSIVGILEDLWPRIVGDVNLKHISPQSPTRNAHVACWQK